ncbi:MAG: Hsp20/alpha crystallin family protein [Algisphaera sp.]
MRTNTCNPNNPFAAFRDLDRVLNGVWSKVEEGVHQTVNTVTAYRINMDVIETNDQLVITAELPGFTKDQVSVSVEDGVMTLEAQRPEVNYDEQDETTVHLNERRTANAMRKFKVPTAYDTTQVNAKLELGLLTLTLPKREEKKPQSIEVK